MTKLLEKDTSYNRPNLHIFSPLARGASFISDVKPYANNYRQTRKWQGGYWSASFDLPGMNPIQMRNFFTNKIGSHFEAKYGGGTVFEGLIWSMDLYQKGVRRRITLDDMRNRVSVSYTGLSGGDSANSKWAENIESQNTYGIIEEILTLGRVKRSTAETYSQTALLEIGRPVAYPMTFKEPEELELDQLQIEVVGYVYALNFLYLDILKTTYTISDAIIKVLGTNNEFLQKGDITTNPTIVAPPDGDIRVWDWMEEIVEIGDGNTPYRIEVVNDRRINYLKASPIPVMHWDGSKLTTRTGRKLTRSHYQVIPGVIRDTTWKNTVLPDDYFLENEQDSIVFEVEAGEKYTQPILKSSHYEDSELMAAWVKNNVDVRSWKEDQKKDK